MENFIFCAVLRRIGNSSCKLVRIGNCSARLVNVNIPENSCSIFLVTQNELEVK